MSVQLEDGLQKLRIEYQLQSLGEEFQRIGGGRTNALQVLGIRRNERRLTRFLRWLLTPDETHGLAGTFLNDFLELCRQGDVDVRSVEQFFTVRREEDDSTEIDLVLVGADACIGVEIKTTHQERGENLRKELSALLSSFPSQDRHELIYLTFRPKDGPVPNLGFDTILWGEVISLLEPRVRALPDGFEKALINDFVHTVKSDVMTDFNGLSESTELYIKYSEAIDAARSAYEDDREAVLDAIASEFFDAKDIDEEWARSNTYSGSYIKLYKPAWHSLDNSVNMEFEPHVNLKPGSSGRDSLDEPHIKIRFDVEGRHAQSMRDEILDKLGESGLDELESSGFHRFTKDESTYKFISKSIPIDGDGDDYDPIEASVEAIHDLRRIIEDHVDETAIEF